MRAKLAFLLIIAPAIVWTLFGFLGQPVSSHISSRFGPRILAGGDGKITDAQVFVKERLKDGAVLVTAACLLMLAYQLCETVGRGIQAPARWIVLGWSGFVGLNVFAAIASQTTLCWCLLFTGKDHTHNFTQWRIKSNLMREIDAPSQAVLIGASQTRTEIDTKVLNERLGRRIWTTELHFPGIDPYEMTLCLERVPQTHLGYVITYVSEATFFSRPDNAQLMFFFGLRDLPDYWALGPGKPPVDRYLVCGLLGDVFPLYRMWEPLVDRARGRQAENLKQKDYDNSLDTNLVHRAQDVAKSMSLGPVCTFHKKEFAVFAKMCAERHSRLVICCGQVNPILERELNPALRPDMMAFLHEMAGNDSNIILLEGPQFPPQVESDYEDLTHVNNDARARFSQRVAEALDHVSREKAL